MAIAFGREICGNLSSAETREWLITNGIGGYGSGTVAGLLTRRYHGLLIAALEPPLARTLLVAKLDETATYNQGIYSLYSNRWTHSQLEPLGYHHIEYFTLEKNIPVWYFACGDARLEKRIWMQQGANTTYIQYKLSRATAPLTLNLKALVNYRDHHQESSGKDWYMTVKPVERGVCVIAYPQATPFYLLSDRGTSCCEHSWHYGFELAQECYRGLNNREDHLQAASFEVSLKEGDSVTFVATTEIEANLNGKTAMQSYYFHTEKLLDRFQSELPFDKKDPPEWVGQLVIAADQFIVDRPDSKYGTMGKTIIAGYPWFGDWGRDTMISLPGLTLATGRPEIARSILRTMGHYVDQGMLPNRFPDSLETPEYNTVDATLWYFEAIRAYFSQTDDEDLLRELYPILTDIITWHCRGTRYHIHLDSLDGLLYAGERGVQLTWMDAKVGDWVVTPRIGKPVEVNALWYNALRTIAQFARHLGQPHQEYEAMADRVLARFSRFWNAEAGYCYDVIDGPEGAETSLRPNQLLAISLPESPLTFSQQKSVVDICAQKLLTSYGLRSLAPENPVYQGHYGGNQQQRDGAYHQGTVWGWLLGVFIIAHFRVYGDRTKARSFLLPMSNHLNGQGLGTLGEIFEGDPPLIPRGCIAQAWTVAEVLRAWLATES
jgi:predicted glycogen debranching enzyme